MASLPTTEKCAMFSIMNKSIFLSLLLVLGAQANSFFGIPILGEPKDQLHAVIYQLMKEIIRRHVRIFSSWKNHLRWLDLL